MTRVEADTMTTFLTMASMISNFLYGIKVLLVGSICKHAFFAGSCENRRCLRVSWGGYRKGGDDIRPRDLLASTFKWSARHSVILGSINSHLVLQAARGKSALIISLQFVRYADIQISLLLVVRPACQVSSHLLAIFDGQNLPQVEDSLLPVRVF